MLLLVLLVLLVLLLVLVLLVLLVLLLVLVLLVLLLLLLHLLDDLAPGSACQRLQRPCGGLDGSNGPCTLSFPCHLIVGCPRLYFATL
eukprot:COSAG02_NODE_1612_length_11675_cov_29.558310_3_plen_88_part_00